MTSINNYENKPNEMFVLLPIEWDIERDGYLMDFVTDDRSPVDVLLRPWMATEEQANLFLELKRPYSLVRAQMSTIPNKLFQYELISNLETITINNNKQSIDYPSLSQKRWSKHFKKKNAFLQINL